MFMKKLLCGLALILGISATHQSVALDIVPLHVNNSTYQMPIPAGYCDVSDQIFGKVMKSMIMESSKDNEDIGTVDMIMNFCEAKTNSPFPRFGFVGYLSKEGIQSQADLNQYARQKMTDEAFLTEQKAKAQKTQQRLGTTQTEIIDPKIEVLEEKPDYLITRTSMTEQTDEIKIEQVQYSLNFFRDGKIFGYHLMAGKAEALPIPDATARLKEVVKEFNQNNS